MELDLRGSPRERGHALGSACHDSIGRAIELWMDELRRIVEDPVATTRSIVASSRFGPHLDTWAPGLSDEIAAIADASGHDPQLVTALSLMDEVWLGVDGAGHGCSTIGAVPADRPPMLGQTMDLPPSHAAVPMLLHIHPDHGPAQHVLTFAGSVGLCGWNDAGIAVCCNSLDMLPARHDGLPVAGTVRAVLACSTLEEAWRIVRSADHASPQHIAVGGPGGLAGFQVSAAGVVEHPVAAGDTYGHTNHPIIDPAAAQLPEGRPAARADSRRRLAFLAAQAPCDLAAAEAALDDRTVPISCVGTPGASDDSISAMTYVAELATPPRVRYRVGPPGTPWHERG